MNYHFNKIFYINRADTSIGSKLLWKIKKLEEMTMKIQKHFVKDFENQKLDEIFGRTMADIENLMKEVEEQEEDVYDTPYLAFTQYTELLRSLKDILVNDTYIENQKLIFNHLEDFQEVIVPRIKLLVAFLNKQFEAGKLYLVGKYEIEFFEMLIKL